MRIRIRMDSKAEAAGELPQFGLIAASESPSVRAWLPSLCLHIGGAIVLSTQAMQLIPPVHLHQQASPLIIRLHGKLYTVSYLPARQGARYKGAPDSGKSLDAGVRTPRQVPKFSVVMTPSQTQAAVTVIREDLPLNLLPDPTTATPSVAVWTADPPKMSPKPFVEPGRTHKELPVAREIALLELAPGGATNIAEHTATGAVRVIAAGPDSIPATDRLVIQAGNAVAAGSAGAVRNREAGNEAHDRNAGGGVHNGDDRPGSATPAAMLIPVPPEVAPPLVTIRRPADGKFDAVVVQSSAAELVEGAQQSLTGKPVYTVYLPMGTRKDWIFQYCVAAASSGVLEDSGPVVRLGADPVIEGPWPTFMVRPPVSLRAGEKYMLVHGYISSVGRVERLRIVREGTGATNDALLRTLTNWEFRPARRDSLPVGVEFVLAIPADVA